MVIKILPHSSYGKTGICLLSINLGFMTAWLVEFRGRALCSFSYPGLKNIGVCFLSLGMLTLEIQTPCCKEVQAAHEETHMRGTEDPDAYPGLTFQLIGSTSLPVNKGQWLSYHRSESTSPQSSWPHFIRWVVPAEPWQNFRFIIKMNYCCLK